MNCMLIPALFDHSLLTRVCFIPLHSLLRGNLLVAALHIVYWVPYSFNLPILMG